MILPSPGRLLVGGLRGSSGKTVTTLGLIAAWRAEGITVQSFKKGPDYIDAAWHALASNRPCYCLDVYMMGETKTARQFYEKSPSEGIAVIEGNRGLFDGFDAKGSYSTAELAKLLATPVLLVVDATKITRTTAALVLGCQKLDPEMELAGVVLNRVAGERHRRIAAEAIEDVCGIPVLGVAPKMPAISAPERHLGLVTPEETPDAARWVAEMARAVAPYLDVARITELACRAREVDVPARTGETPEGAKKARIGVIRDSAFPFYYAENLDALRESGAELVWIRSLDNEPLPEIDGLYLGGGFPETHAEQLEGMDRFRESLRRAVESGLPVYAECGGTVYLGRRLYYEGRCFKMAGILPVDFEFCARPQGHGYTVWKIDRENPFYPVGLEVRGHEFHYTRVKVRESGLESVARVERGTGVDGEREGFRVHNVVAFYGHVNALGSPEWAPGLVEAAVRHRLG